jgi:hypothetical protein
MLKNNPNVTPKEVADALMKTMGSGYYGESQKILESLPPNLKSLVSAQEVGQYIAEARDKGLPMEDALQVAEIVAKATVKKKYVNQFFDSMSPKLRDAYLAQFGNSMIMARRDAITKLVDFLVRHRPPLTIEQAMKKMKDDINHEFYISPHAKRRDDLIDNPDDIPSIKSDEDSEDARNRRYNLSTDKETDETGRRLDAPPPDKISKQPVGNGPKYYVPPKVDVNSLKTIKDRLLKLSVPGNEELSVYQAMGNGADAEIRMALQMFDGDTESAIDYLKQNFNLPQNAEEDQELDNIEEPVRDLFQRGIKSPRAIRQELDSNGYRYDPEELDNIINMLQTASDDVGREDQDYRKDSGDLEDLSPVSDAGDDDNYEVKDLIQKYKDRDPRQIRKIIHKKLGINMSPVEIQDVLDQMDNPDADSWLASRENNMNSFREWKIIQKRKQMFD